MTDTSFMSLSAVELGRLIADREVSPVSVAEASLQRIEALEPKLNAFITVTPERAIEDARRAEMEIAAGNIHSPLHGVPIALKDLYATAGIRTTSGSALDANFVPTEDSAAAARMARAGTVLMGKTTMVEFAYGGTEHNDLYGPANNPWGLGRITGGSSTGSAAAVAGGEVSLALGTDTAGSVRNPCALSGLSGLKPTYGLVSRFGVTPLSWSLDHAGPMAHTVEDLAVAMNILAGYDPRDGSSVQQPSVDFTAGLGIGVRGLRIGVPWTYVSRYLQHEVRVSFEAALLRLSELGAEVEEVNIPELEWTLPMGVMTAAEVASFHGDRILTHGDSYSPGIRRRIEAARFVPGHAYVQAQRVRALFVERLNSVFASFDLLATPSMLMTAHRHEERLTEIDGRPVPPSEPSVRFARPFNFNGSPAASVQCGFSSNELPIGLQLVGKPWDDALVLQAANAYQQTTEWHRRRPEF